LFLSPVVLSSQSQSIELGIDGGMSLYLNERTVSSISIPNQSLRFGLFPISGVSIEPSFSLTWIDGQNSQPITSASFWLSGLFHFTRDRSRPQLFLRPTAGLEYGSYESNSNTQYAAGGYVGVKLPIAHHLAVRVEAGYERRIESDNLVAGDVISSNLGISLFLR